MELANTSVITPVEGASNATPVRMDYSATIYIASVMLSLITGLDSQNSSRRAMIAIRIGADDKASCGKSGGDPYSHCLFLAAAETDSRVP